MNPDLLTITGTSRLTRRIRVLLIAMPLLSLPAAAFAEHRIADEVTLQSQAPSEVQKPEAVAGQQTLEEGRRGMRLLMNGSPDQAITIFRQIEQQDPDSAVGYLLEADATWWKIYLTIGNLIDPDVFDVANTQTSAYDAHFFEVLDTAISKAEANIHAKRDLARNYLYEGLGYGLRARFTGLRDSDLPTARAGKRMRWLLLQAVKLDSNLNDAYLGLGIYNYFVDTLPTIVKLLKFLIALPGGDRELGLDQLRRAADKGDLVAGEAKFYLAKDYSRPSEQQYAKSLQLFQDLERQYPDNMLWKLLVGSLQIRLGKAEEGESRYREVLARTKNASSDVDQALHRESIKAIQRRHPGEHLE